MNFFTCKNLAAWPAICLGAWMWAGATLLADFEVQIRQAQAPSDTIALSLQLDPATGIYTYAWSPTLPSTTWSDGAIKPGASNVWLFPPPHAGAEFYFHARFSSTEDPDHDELDNQGEFAAHTQPDNADTDEDGMPDGWEVFYTLDPLQNDGALDKDSDGANNLTELYQGRDPTKGVQSGNILVLFTTLE